MSSQATNAGRAALFQTLARLQRDAELVTKRAHGFRGEDLAGFVESVAVDELGRCWIVGWLQGNIPDESGIHLVDGQKFIGAVAFTRFSRDDVPEGATGVVGLLAGDWRPTALTEQIFLVLEAVAPRYMRGLAPLVVVPIAQVAGAIEQARLDARGGHFGALAGLLTDQETWIPGLARAVGRHTSIGFDSIIMLPRFGCVIEGWVVSPVERVSDFALRVGDVIRRCDMRATFRKARHDLSTAFPNHIGLLHESGFVAFFSFLGELSLSGMATLKLEYESGASTNHVLPDQEVLWLQRGVGEEQLLHCYPHLEHETFFPDLVAARRECARVERPLPRTMAAHRCDKLLVRAVGPSLSDVYRAIDELTEHGAWLAQQGWHVAILGQDEARHHLLSLSNELPELGLPAISLFLQGGSATVDDAAFVLRETGCETFLFAQPEARLTRQAMSACLDPSEDASLGAMSEGAEGLPPALFGWKSDAFQRFSAGGGGWRALPFRTVASIPICGELSVLTPFLEKVRLAGLAA